ncbi:MAG: response regulator [Candidatus Shapirobacteria bacterium]|jgi:CheY-like chemotaxis protein
MKKILIVDDDEAILEVLKAITEMAGYGVQTATCGEEALTVVQNERPDLIVLDMLMPGISGKQVCEYLKMNPKTKRIPVVMISANLRDQDFRQKPWAEEFLEKPLDMDRYLKTISRELEKTGAIA